MQKNDLSFQNAVFLNRRLLRKVSLMDISTEQKKELIKEISLIERELKNTKCSIFFLCLREAKEKLVYLFTWRKEWMN